MNARGLCQRFVPTTLCLLLCTLPLQAHSADLSTPQASRGLWSHENLFAWGAAVFDERQRTPEERAHMLERLGFKQVAFNWREQNIPDFGAEIDTLRRHDIKVLAWALYVTDGAGVSVPWKDYLVESPDVLMGGRRPGVNAPTLKELLGLFQAHHVHPQLWLVQPLKRMQLPPEAKGMSTIQILQSPELLRFINQQSAQHWRQDLAGTNTPEGQEARVRKEADRIAALVTLTAPYGVHVELYNHNGWFGMMNNQLAVIERLKARGITDVGMVYNFDHARDELHDDTVEFRTLWKGIEPYVVAINVAGTHAEPMSLLPSQGDRELDMMRTVQNSGWQGPVGVNAETGGDAEVTFKNCLVGLDWLSAELRHAGSGGARPFPTVP